MPVDLEAAGDFSATGEQALADDWWTALRDPALDRVVEQALTDNFDVRAAYARLQAAEATVRRERSPLFPALQGFADSSVGTDDPFGGFQRVPLEIGVEASYEVDLWGRIRAELQAEVQRREASRADLQAAALSVSAEVVRTWVAIAATTEQLALLDEQLQANEGMAAVMDARFRNGVVRQADALRQQRLLEATRAERIRRLADLEVFEHRLAVLLGRPPQQDPGALPEALPALPPLPETGIPLDLVRRRPDVLAAEHRLRTADAEVAVAVANQFPRLSLRASASNAPTSAQALFEGWVASLAANLAIPLLEAGARRAEVTRTNAVLDQRLYDYGSAVLVSFQEVEDALARNRRQAELLDNLETQVDLAVRTAEGLQAQYTGGMDVGYLDVLTARTTAQQLRRQLISARRQHLELRIDLFRALGAAPPLEDDA